MKNLFNYLSEQKRRSLTVSACCLLFLFSCFVTSASALEPVVTITPVYSDVCGDVECCLHITIAIGSGETLNDFKFTISTTMGGVSDHPSDCWDFSCAGTNMHLTSGTAPTVSLTPAGGPPYTGLDFSFGTAVSGPSLFEFMLCPKSGTTCWTEWTDLNWTQTYNTSSTDGPNDFTLPGSCNNVLTCPHCDEVALYSPNDCYEVVCITQHWPTTTLPTSLNLHFNPALPSYPCTVGVGCSITSPQPDPGSSGWMLSPVGGSGGADWSLTNSSGLAGCESVCIDVPKCSLAEVSRTVTVTNDNGPCSTGASATFKISASGTTPNTTSTGGSATQNYPNPLSSLSQFKTTIPFELTSEGVAKISVFDVAGKVVFTDAQEFVGLGKHTFYFTGEQLPAGKYFYTIESPLGTVIVKQSLLIVK